MHGHDACGRGSEESAQQRIDIEHQMIEMAIEASTNDKKPAEEPNSKLINVTQSVSGIGLAKNLVLVLIVYLTIVELAFLPLVDTPPPKR